MLGCLRLSRKEEKSRNFLASQEKYKWKIIEERFFLYFFPSKFAYFSNTEATSTTTTLTANDGDVEFQREWDDFQLRKKNFSRKFVLSLLRFLHDSITPNCCLTLVGNVNNNH